MAFGRLPAQEHAHLAVVDFTRRAAILPGDSGRLVTLFNHAGFVDGQHGVLLAQAGQDRLAVIIAHGLRIPLRTTEQVLEGLGVGQADRLGQLPTVFALHLAQEALEVGGRRGARRQVGEMGRQARDGRFEGRAQLALLTLELRNSHKPQ